MNKVYEITTTSGLYGGFALVGASSAKEASEIISQFKFRDIHNKSDSWGYDDYVEEYDALEDVYTNTTGIIKYGIYYTG